MNSLKNKRIFKSGFTLVELVGVVIILALIALIAFPAILNAIRGTQGQISDASKQIIYSATSSYLSDNANSYPKKDGNVYCITLATLKQNNKLSIDIYDESGNEISQDKFVQVIITNNDYSYEMVDTCTEER